VFVPLIGTEGRDMNEKRPPDLPKLIGEAAEPLPPFEDPDFAAAFDRFGDRRVVLLGEASHGTAEFYRARAAITRRLIEQHGFSIVAVEADWPDAASLDRYVRQRPADGAHERPFKRFPTWMWMNTEVDGFIRWLREHNAALDPEKRAGFFGLDLYNMSGSMEAVLDYLERTDPEAAEVAHHRYGCLMRWSRDPAAYGRQVLHGRYDACEEKVVAQLRDVLNRSLPQSDGDPDARLDAAQNARLVASAERYYRVMYHGGAESWNLRDTHMFETLEHLLDAHGPEAKAVVWAHNSHIGDARATDMGRTRGEINIGQLCRERWGDEAALIGFGTHTGTVAAATDWDEDMEVKTVLPSRADSYERLCHDTGVGRFLLDMRAGQNETLRKALQTPRLERFIGVIYRPDTEYWSHYAEAVLPEQFDAYLWLDTTEAVTPLPARAHAGGEDTYPFGL